MTGKLIELEDELELVTRWVKQRCVIDATSVSTVAELESSYVDWAASENQVAMNKVRLARRLQALGFDRTNIGTKTAYRGLRLQQ